MGSIIVMGVSGCGKSTLGKLLAERTGKPFLDADDFHLPGNIAKMRAGIPLEDADRLPWLQQLHQALRQAQAAQGCVLACSALKESYRQILRGDLPEIAWIYLRGTREQLWQRLTQRQGHFMPAALLDSQLVALEEPAYATVFDLDQSSQEMVEAWFARGN